MKLRSILKKLAISLASLIVVVLLCEIVARLAEPGPFSLVDSSPYNKEPGMGHVHKPDFAGRWDGTWYATDSLGLRGEELHPKKTANELRVLAVGDSCTFGKGVDEPDTWPRQFERLLASRLPAGHSALVANGGVNGYSAKQYLEVVKLRGAQLQPNLIVVGYTLNDFPNQTRALDRVVYQNKENLRAAIPYDLRNALGRFAIFRWMRATYYVMNRERDFAAAEKMAGAVKDQLNRDSERVAKEIERLEGMAAAANEMNAKLCVFLFPYESQVYLDKYDDSAVAWLRGLCEERKIPFIDALDEFRARARSQTPPRQLFLRGDRYHPNPEGYGLIAARVLDSIQTLGWLPKAE